MQRLPAHRRHILDRARTGIRKITAGLVTLTLAAGLLAIGAPSAQAAMTWQKVLIQNDETGTNYPGPPPNGTSVTFTPFAEGSAVEATYSQPHCDTTNSCYYTNIGPGAPEDYRAYLDFTFDQWIADVRWNLEAIDKQAGHLPDTSRVFVTTDSGATWEPLNFNGTGTGGHVGNITHTTDFGVSTPAWNVGSSNTPQTGGVSCVWSNISDGCGVNIQIDIHFPVAINGVRVQATGIPGDGAGANLFNPYVGYDPDNPPVPPAPPSPTVTEISPIRGPIGGNQVVSIKGTHFIDGDTTVKLGGASCTPVAFVSTTEISCTTGAHAAGPTDVEVVTSNGDGTLPNGYTYVSAPAVTSVAPNVGPMTAGQAVTIKGTDFTGTTSVTIGGDTCTDLVVVDDTTITCKVPAAPGGTAGATDVVVNAPGGVSSPGTYTYVEAPTVTEINPVRGPTAGGQTVTIKGTNFVSGLTTVSIGGANCTTVTFVSATEITCTTTTHAAELVDVAITTPGGTGTLPNAYTYVAAPTATEISPAFGPTTGGQTVTIKGTNFVSGLTTVSIGGANCTTVTFVSATEITCTTTTHAAELVDVAITTPGGTDTLPNAYTYVEAPTATETSPDRGPIVGDQTLTVTGANFVDGHTTVHIDGVACSPVTFISPTKVSCKTPEHAAGGPFDVAVATPGGEVILAAAYTYVPQPTIVAVAPASGPLAGGNELTVTGTNLQGATVSIGGQACTSVAIDAGGTSLTCRIPVGLQPGPVAVGVTTAGGTVDQSNAYTYLASGPEKRPLKPQKLKLSGGGTAPKTVVSWKAPKNPGGSRPTQWYRITLKLRGCPAVVMDKRLAKNVNSYSFTRTFLLKTAKCQKAVRGDMQLKVLRYRVRVQAFNTKGGGPITAMSFTIRR